jgi:hypothetical protein
VGLVKSEDSAVMFGESMNTALELTAYSIP